ncbi:hypothetical protein D6D22_10771, partial [Aureobasidium pullulans]
MQDTLVVLAGLAALSAASPLQVSPKVQFTVPQVATNNTNVPAPPIALLKAISKYGGTPPTAVKAVAAAASQSGTVVATSYEATSQQSGHSVYNVNSGKKLTGETWKISYGDGSSASGVVYSDKVVVRAAATSISSAFIADTDNNGLLGLAFSSINTSSLARKLFTVNLKKGAARSYDFGFISTAKYTRAITYVNQFTTTSYAVRTAATVSSSYSAIANTGTTLMLLPNAI